MESMMQMIRDLFGQGRGLNRRQGLQFEGRVVDQIREDVLVFMHLIGPSR